MTIVQVLELGWLGCSRARERDDDVEPVDPLECRQLEIAEAEPRPLGTNEFALGEPVERLGESSAVANAEMLSASIAVVDQLVQVGAVALA